MTEKQYLFALRISKTLNISLPDSYSVSAFSKFIDKNLLEFQEKQKEEHEKRKFNYELAKMEDIMQSKELYEQNFPLVQEEPM